MLKRFLVSDPSGILALIIALGVISTALGFAINFLGKFFKYTSEVTIKGGKVIEDYTGDLPDLQFEFNRSDRL